MRAFCRKDDERLRDRTNKKGARKLRRAFVAYRMLCGVDQKSIGRPGAQG
jgi:hypothetical protein